MSETLVALLLFAVGAVSGALNVIAGGGSFLTLPVMIFLGLPPTVANGTNRVAMLVQNAAAVWGFHRYRLMDWTWLRAVAAPSLVGAALGTWAAIEIGDEAFRRALAGIMVAVTLWTLWNPLTRGRTNAVAAVAGDAAVPLPAIGAPEADAGREARGATVAAAPSFTGPAAMLAFFAVGVYGGFVQAGVGFLILAVTTCIGLNLVVGNALKVLLVLIYTPLTLVLFALSGNVDWAMGAALAAGNLLGGLAGVHLAVLKGHAWVRRVVTATVIVFAVKLWISP